MKKKSFIGIMCMLALTAVAATVIPVKLPVQTFTTTVDVPISNSDLQPMYLTAIEMSFAAEVANTCTIEHVSSGRTNKLLEVTSATMQTMTWYVPRPLFLNDGDIVRITNTDGSEAVAKLSAEKYRN